MPHGDNHPDLLALAEGRLSRQEEDGARQHLEGCGECRRQFADLGETLAIMNGLAREVKQAMAQDPELAGEVERMFPNRGKGLRPYDNDELCLDQSEMAGELPAALVEKTKSLKKSSLTGRLGKSMRELAGKSASSAREWVEDALSGGTAPQGAPAIREDATEVDEDKRDDEPEKTDNGSGNNKK